MRGELKNTHKINNGNLGFHNPLEPLRSSNATMIVGARSKTEQCLNRIELGNHWGLYSSSARRKN